MWQFLNGDDSAFAALEQRATGSCVVFPQEAMPPGAIPGVGRVSIEISRDTGTTVLLVDRDIRYQGRNSTVQQWLDRGQLEFATFADMRQWVQHDLKACYDSGGPRSASELTDLTAVDQQTLWAGRPAYVDEDGLFRALTT